MFGKGNGELLVANGRSKEAQERLWAFFILVFGLLLRIVLMSHPGYVLDQDWFFREWAEKLPNMPFNQVNPDCRSQVFDYPPFFFYVMYVFGHIADFLNISISDIGPNAEYPYVTSLAGRFLLKVPAVMADLALGILVFYIVRKRFKSPAPHIAMALVVFNPALMHNSAVWGQVDGITALFAIGIIYLLATRRMLWASALLALSITFKPQMLFLSPVVGAVVLRELWKGNWRTLLIPPIMVSTVTIVVAPFAGTLNPAKCMQWLFNLFSFMEGKYSYISFNMWNIWKVVADESQQSLDTAPILAVSGSWMPSFHQVGLALLVMLSLFVFIMLLFRSEERNVWLGAALMMLGYTLLGTRMHERYPLVAVILTFIAGLYFINLRFVYYVLTCVHLINVHAVLSSFLVGTKEEGKLLLNFEPSVVIRNLTNHPAMVLVCTMLFYSSFILMAIIYARSAFVKEEDDVEESNRLQTFVEAARAKIPDAEKVVEYRPFKWFSRAFDTAIPINRFTRADGRILLFLLVVTSILYLYNCWNPPYTYFDEEYFAKTSRQIAQLEHLYPTVGYPWETTHPHMGKLLQASFIKMFGFSPVAYRMPNLIFGILTVLFLYLLGRDVLRSRRLGFWTAFFFLMGGLGLAQARLCTIDSPSVFFMVLSFFCFYKYWGDIWPRVPALSLTAIAIGLAIACKWTSVFAMGFLIFMMFCKEITLPALRIRDLIFSKREPEAPVPIASEPISVDQTPDATEPVPIPAVVEPYKPWYERRPFTGFGVGMLMMVLYLMIIPIIIYVFSFVRLLDMSSDNLKTLTVYRSGYEKSLPWRVAWKTLEVVGEADDFDTMANGDKRVTRLKFSTKQLEGIYALAVERSRDMYDYHSSVGKEADYEPHPYESRWYHWPLLLKIIWYDTWSSTYYDGKLVVGAAAIGNPLLFWFGLPCMLVLLWGAVEEKRKGLIFATIGFLFLYLPWVVSPRKVTFFYHYLPSQPFLMMGVAYTMEDFRQDRLTRWFTVLFVVGVIICFLFFYPWLNWIPLSEWGFKARKWSSSWGVGY